MSGRKIVRLKTPGKTGQEGKSGEETRLESEEFSQQSTLLLVKSVACSEELQVALINEINKVYRELTKLKQATDTHEEESRILKNRVEVAEREVKTQRELYQLERDNHRRLRKFYQAREQEWISIVNEHRRILEQYHRTPSSGPAEDQYSQLESMYTNLEQMLSTKDVKAGQARKERWARGAKLTSSVDREDSLSPKFQLNLHSNKNGSRDTSQTRIDPFKSSSSSLRPKREGEPRLTDITPPKQNDEKTPPKPANTLLQTIIRRTYDRYREKLMAVSDIEQLEDMVKLKNAKTSTRQRLAKTVRKLDFPVNTEAQIKTLCECVEKAVLDKHRSFKGEFAFDFLIERLKYYETLARSDVHRSLVCKIQHSVKPSELPLESAIKDEKAIHKIKKSLQSTLQSRGQTPRKLSNDSRDPERMHQSHVFNRTVQATGDPKK